MNIPRLLLAGNHGSHFVRAAGALLSIVILLSILSPPTWADASKTYEIKLTGGAADEQLINLGQQTNHSILFSPTTTKNFEFPALQGRYSLADALEKLLTDHCLSYQRVAEQVVVVLPDCNTTATSSPELTIPTNDSVAGTSAPLSPTIEELIVQERYITGSRIRTPGAHKLNPVKIIERPTIDLSGSQSIGEVLRYLPSVAGNSTSTLISNGGNGNANITLRGLPASNTLVLVNGRRLNPDAVSGSSADLNGLPLAMVDRFEILKDGASAIYGSDAVAGVVNIITRQDVDGLLVDSFVGQADRGDLLTQRYSALYGAGGSDWLVNLGASYYDQQPLFSRDRSVSRSSDDRQNGGIDRRSSATVPARVVVSDQARILRDSSLDPTDTNSYRPAISEDRFEFRDFTTSIVPSTRWSLFTEANYRFTQWQIFAEALYSATEAKNTLAPTPLFTSFDDIDISVSTSNPNNPFDVPLNDIRRRFVELGPRFVEDKSQSRRLVFGASGELGQSHWEAAVVHSYTKARQLNQGILNGANLAIAVGDNCSNPCRPLNLLAPENGFDTAALADLHTTTRTTTASELNSLSLNWDFPLFSTAAGTVEVASGLELREETFEVVPDRLLAAGVTIGAANFGPTDGHRNIKELYAEIYLPLVRRERRVMFDLQIASRLSDYSDFGRVSNPRVAFNFRPSENLSLHASFAKGFRAPTLNQLVGSAAESFETLSDPCTNFDNVGVLPGCLMQSDPTLTQFLITQGGERNLKAERSTTSTLGVEWQLPGGADWVLHVNAYRIAQSNVVDSSAQFIINQNTQTGAFNDRLSRDSNGNIRGVVATLLNIGRRSVEGLDVRFAYSGTQSRWGTFSAAFNATHIHSFKDKFDPATNSVEQAGTFSDSAAGGNGALPDWKANIGVSWQHNSWQAQYTLHHISSVREDIPIIQARRRINSWQTHNIQVSFAGSRTAWVRITLGANNLFDRAPPFSASAFNDSYDGRTYDLTGRYIYLGLKHTF